jgi:hypothetical protein
MSLALDGLGPPPHLLQTKSVSWPCPYYPHDYPASASSPAPMSPQSLQSYMSHMPESPSPAQDISSLPTSTWYGPSVSAPDCQNQVRTLLLPLLAKKTSSLTQFTLRVATPHMANICLHMHRPLPCPHPLLLTIIWGKHQFRLRALKPQQSPCRLSPSMLGTLSYPSQPAHPRNPRQIPLVLMNTHLHVGDQIRTSWNARTAAQVACILLLWMPLGP